jgi:4-methyl-5(b-hydroxyethyl)-thiazole monophosphate biosynthesis
MSKRVLVPIADGSEELEAICIVDVLRRAGAEVVVVTVDGLHITASRGVKLVAEKFIFECKQDTFDLIALPGGMPGAEHLRDSVELIDMLKKQKKEGRLYAAICASPAIVLQHHGLLKGKKATCHPNHVQRLENKEAVESRVVKDGNCITSQGPGTAIEFSLKLVELLFGAEKAREVADSMIV